MATNRSKTVPPLCRLSSWTSMRVPDVSPSVVAIGSAAQTSEGIVKKQRTAPAVIVLRIGLPPFDRLEAEFEPHCFPPRDPYHDPLALPMQYRRSALRAPNSG